MTSCFLFSSKLSFCQLNGLDRTKTITQNLRLTQLESFKSAVFPVHLLQLVGTHIRYTNWHVNLFHYNYCVNSSHFRSQLEPMSFVWKLMVDHVHLNSVQFNTYWDGQCSIKWRFPPTSFLYFVSNKNSTSHQRKPNQINKKQNINRTEGVIDLKVRFRFELLFLRFVYSLIVDRLFK